MAIGFSVILLISVGLQQAFATTIDFDTFPDETVPADLSRITNQYAACGVSLFTTEDPGGPEIRSTFNLAGSSPPNILVGKGPGFSFIQFIGIEFSSPVSGDISVNSFEVRHAGLRLQAFDSANVLVDVFDVPPSSVNIPVSTMTVSGTDIVKLVISQIVPQTGGFVDGYAIDDLEFPGPSCEIQDDLVGGEIIPIEATSLLLAGAQSTTWLIPAVLSSVGIGLVLVRKMVQDKSK